MVDKHAIANDLTEAFIKYQYRLENPMPTDTEGIDGVEQYRNNPIFHRKVDSLVAGVMAIIGKHT